jgi:S-formylglutathione hydrolase FrmB
MKSRNVFPSLECHLADVLSETGGLVTMKFVRLILITILTGTAGPLFSQPRAFPVQKGRFERVKVHGKSLEGNLEGDPPDRDVSIYLPPGYDAHGTQRYPAVYLLHGYGYSDEGWYGPNTKSGFQIAGTTLPAVADKVISTGRAREMILVMPNAVTFFQGSMYSNSVTTGNWEEFITHDLVNYVDTHYRTLSQRVSRGLAGLSMGGYGTLRIGMKYPDLYSSIYMLSACCLKASLNPRDNWGFIWDQAEGLAKAEAIHSPASLTTADGGTMRTLAEAAAWSPNPKNPPFFLDLPSKGGLLQPEVVARWAANAPLAMIDQYIPNLKRFRAIGFDVGDKDVLLVANNELDRVLNQYGIPHSFEVHDGDHTNRLVVRIETKVLPFFSDNLSFAITDDDNRKSRR